MKLKTPGTSTVIRVGIAGLAILIATACWFYGYSNSPTTIGELAREKDVVDNSRQRQRPDPPFEKEMAEAYWLRYPDVRNNSYWGPSGPLGIRGARDHYRRHGRRENRVFGDLAKPENRENEEKLARAYWQRYPDVRHHIIWGEAGRLGIYGARDHYRYLGRLQGKKWEAEQ